LKQLLAQETQILQNLFVVIHNGSAIYQIKINQNSSDFEMEKLVEWKLGKSLEIFEVIKNQFQDLLVLNGEGHKSKSKPTSVVLKILINS
jgi:hypothetical protein